MRTLSIPILLAILTAGTVAPGAFADRSDHRRRHEGDHDLAREAVRSGQALPLLEILSRLRTRLGGEVVHVEFEQEDGRFIYEFRVIGAEGQLRRVQVDAATAEILEQESR